MESTDISIRSSEEGEYKPTNLYHVVEREPGKKDVGEKFCYAEDAIHHPVGQPLCVIIFIGAFDGLDAERKKCKSQLYFLIHKPYTAPKIMYLK